MIVAGGPSSRILFAASNAGHAASPSGRTTITEPANVAAADLEIRFRLAPLARSSRSRRR